MKVTYDLNDDAPRYVIEALMAVDRPLSSYDLADNYDPPKPNNLAELRNEYRDESGDVGRIGDYDVKEWLIVNAAQEINDCNDGPEQGDSIIVDEQSDGYRLADGVYANQLQVGGERLIRTRALPDLFTPETGVWADN